jgi:hypothetical protein
MIKKKLTQCEEKMGRCKVGDFSENLTPWYKRNFLSWNLEFNIFLSRFSPTFSLLRVCREHKKIRKEDETP